MSEVPQNLGMPIVVDKPTWGRSGVGVDGSGVELPKNPNSPVGRFPVGAPSRDQAVLSAPYLTALKRRANGDATTGLPSASRSLRAPAHVVHAIVCAQEPPKRPHQRGPRLAKEEDNERLRASAMLGEPPMPLGGPPAMATWPPGRARAASPDATWANGETRSTALPKCAPRSWRDPRGTTCPAVAGRCDKHGCAAMAERRGTGGRGAEMTTTPRWPRRQDGRGSDGNPREPHRWAWRWEERDTTTPREVSDKPRAGWPAGAADRKAIRGALVPNPFTPATELAGSIN